MAFSLEILAHPLRNFRLIFHLMLFNQPGASQFWINETFQECMTLSNFNLALHWIWAQVEISLLIISLHHKTKKPRIKSSVLIAATAAEDILTCSRNLD
jgi:hypothetical protein